MAFSKVLEKYRLARQVTKSSQVKVMTLTLFPIKKSQSHDFDFAYSKNKSQVKSLTFFKVNDLTLTFFLSRKSSH